MKKIILTAALALILFTALLYVGDFCLPKNEPISCPDEADVVSVFVTDINGKEIKADDELDKVLLWNIGRASSTRKQSVNDRPYAEDYYTVAVNTEDKVYCYYVYQEGLRYYIEKPYEGIYKSDRQTFDFLTEHFGSR